MPHYHLVTGKLAADGLQRLLDRLTAAHPDLRFTLEILPITVAALMTTRWIARHLGDVPETADEVWLPGYCAGEVSDVAQRTACPVRKGPKDYRELPQFLGQPTLAGDDYGGHDIEILAEINHAPRLPSAHLRTLAQTWAAQGADVIDVGCVPGETWTGVGDCVKMLRDAGLRVSIDSWNATEVAAAVAAGAELVLSVDSRNAALARDWGCEVVVVPDDPHTGAGLEQTVDYLTSHRVPLRIDPILEPLGCGFAASLHRYYQSRQRFPDAEIMMGIGNVTELTAVDSAGVNAVLLGYCQELGIRSVLTTEVITWAQSSVRECAVARRMMHYAARQGTIPKHLPDHLVMLRDPRAWEVDEAELARLAQQLRDRNIRLFLCGGQLHALRRDVHIQDTDPFRLFERLQAACPDEIDPSHAFYLGYEAAKAVTARTLGKTYRQDDALQWGPLTVEEQSHRNRRAAGAEAPPVVPGEPDERGDEPS